MASQDSSVSIVTTLRAAEKIPLLSPITIPAQGPNHLLPNGYPVLSHGMKRSEGEADKLPPSSVEVKIHEAIPLLLHTPSWCVA
jgi:hypothetical protein